MKIITKPTEWVDTENPYVDTLLCPLCGKPGARLDPAFVVTDGPEQNHVNLSKVNGRLLTMQGKCPGCEHSFLMRILMHEAGTYTWSDIGVQAKEWNALLEMESKDQLPCMCGDCQKKGTVKPAQDESTASPCLKAKIAKLKATPKKGETVDAEVIDEPKTVPIVQQQGMALTPQQHQAIGKAMKMNWAALSEKLQVSEAQAKQQFVQVMEAYVRIKFATFQPTPNDDPDMPPRFPTVVPKAIFEAFRQSGEKHLCEYLITGFAMVDNVLNRPDLPASIVFHHMCRMCKVEACKYHPSKREET